MGQMVLTVLILGWTMPLQAMNYSWPIESIDLFEYEASQNSLDQATSHFHPCMNLHFRKQQKELFSRVRDMMNSDSSDLKNNISRLQIQYKDFLKSSVTTQKSMKPTLEKLFQLEEELKKMRKAYVHAIFFEIATPEQRGDLYRCFGHFHHHKEWQTRVEKEKQHQQFHQNASTPRS